MREKQIIKLFKFQKIFLVKIIYKKFHNFAFKFEIEFLLKSRIRFLVSPHCELNFGNQLCVLVFNPQNFMPNFIIYFEVLFSSFKTFMISPSPMPATSTIKIISAISRAVIFYSR
ncbi:hypothetical protein B9N65_06875 [Campylobacter concisus]|uniref:Uncharacterized protein n=1 Tax=Campylobacter concisus TaxID=199 RepID=A0A1Y5MFG2_9BACT|nr:hypothetical protein B9N65_06875 [Campylobacter concisus]